MPNEEKTVDQVQPKRSEPAKYVTDTDDILTRCIAIDYRFDFLRDPENTLKGESLERWHAAHKKKIAEWTAERTGDDPERLQDEENLTEDQRKELAKTEALHRTSVLIALNQSNYMAAIHCISEYCEALADNGQDDIYKPLREEWMPQALLNGSLANVPLCAVLYFFATHVEVNPEDNERTMTPEDRSALLAVFDAMDALYRERRAEINSERALLEAFIKHEHPDAQVAATGEDQNALMPLHSIGVDKLVLPNTSLTNAMTSGIVDGIQHLFRIGGSAKKPINMACILTYEGDDVTLNGRQPFDDFDSNVFDAICTLYQYGDPSHVMTDAMIYNVMIGGDPNTDKPSKKMSDLISNSLNKMRFINVKIDKAKEWQRLGITLDGEQIDSDVTEYWFAKATPRKVKAGGKSVSAWLFEEQPIVFAHAEAAGQVLTVPSNLLAIREVSTMTLPSGQVITSYKTGKLYNTETCIILRGRLLRRIEGMKGKNKLDNNVVALEGYRKNGKWHDGLYDIANTHKTNENGKKPPLSRTEKDRVRSTIECILDYWISLDYIKGYTPQKRGRAITGYKILL